ncbi:ribosomal RNA small subunit methyltransferase C [Rhodopirellula maiorica SM1]|uniref:Ribosomal RNA small subunit methyltransferase C n=1 Tax=Rhodopirellula maiorica SM1 TaxID=1265738 RepID=M5RFJ8_9BACT|nr:methyltransferase [Rhodopirellula maiorica]EMI17851.1 ribosomal RNA small subunit methyltransferase C [Rhodopirellula maiorica SM1]
MTNETDKTAPQSLPARTSEAALYDVAKDLPGSRILSTSLGRGQAARWLYRDRSDANVSLWYLDQFQQRLAIADHDADINALPETASPNPLHSLSILCQTDLPEGEVDLALIPCSVRGEAELQRDLLQQAYNRLVIGGRLVTSVDNVNDRWLHDQLKPFGAKISVRPSDDAVVYVLRKDHELKRQRSFDCEFTYRFRGQTITAITRPGVFSHRRLDAGAKALMDAVTVEPGQRLIDIGCGCGSVAMALAMQAEDIHALAIDSNARAIECTRMGATKNKLADLDAQLTCEGDCQSPASYDIAVGNPPYFANFQIARLFVDAAKRALRPRGRMYIVTKQPEWYEENLVTEWHDIRVIAGKQYAVVEAWK